MFDFLKNENAQLVAAEKREKDFVRERDTFNSAHADDATYFESQERKSDLLRWQQDFKDELEEMYHELLSEHKTSNGWEPKKYKEFNPKTKCYDEITIRPLCSPAFADKIRRLALKPWLNKSAVNSNLDEKKIVKMLRNTHNDIVCAISDGWGIHGIESIDEANAICRTIKNYVDPAAYRAWNGWTKKLDSTMLKRIESQQEVGGRQNEQKGLWGLLGNG